MTTAIAPSPLKFRRAEERPALLTRARLPTSLTPIVGRNDIFAEINNIYADDSARLVTLTGAGGVG